MDSVCSTHGEKGNVYRILVRKPEGKPRRTWEDNIKTDLTEIVWGCMDWIHFSEDRGQ
jgi:hypothetical protein